MKIGELASRTGVSRDTIRFYERSGLLKNITRPFKWNNYKDYEEENVARIKIIKCLKKFGLTLKEGKEILQEKDNNPNIEVYRREKAAKKLQEIEEKIAELEDVKSNLLALLNTTTINKG
ncbi:MAG: MerR family transcriptional regulator [Bacteroidota bacterium]